MQNDKNDTNFPYFPTGLNRKCFSLMYSFYSQVPNKRPPTHSPPSPLIFFRKKFRRPRSFQDPRLLISSFFRGKQYFCYKIRSFKTFHKWVNCALVFESMLLYVLNVVYVIASRKLMAVSLFSFQQCLFLTVSIFHFNCQFTRSYFSI